MVSVSINKGGNVPFALKWGPRGQRPPTAWWSPPKYTQAYLCVENKVAANIIPTLLFDAVIHTAKYLVSTIYYIWSKHTTLDYIYLQILGDLLLHNHTQAIWIVEKDDADCLRRGQRIW